MICFSHFFDNELCSPAINLFLVFFDVVVIQSTYKNKINLIFCSVNLFLVFFGVVAIQSTFKNKINFIFCLRWNLLLTC